MAAMPSPNYTESILTESDFTHSTNSTVWGPGALSGKAIKALGEISLDMIITLIIYRRLATIKRTFDRQPSIFVKREVSDEVRQMERDLQELRKDKYSRSIRASAISLFIDMRSIRHQFGRIRDAWNTNPRSFTEPQNDEERRQMAEILCTLRELCRSQYSEGIRKMAASVIHRIAVARCLWKKNEEFEALQINAISPHERITLPLPWKDLESSIES